MRVDRQPRQLASALRLRGPVGAFWLYCLAGSRIASLIERRCRHPHSEGRDAWRDLHWSWRLSPSFSRSVPDAALGRCRQGSPEWRMSCAPSRRRLGSRRPRHPGVLRQSPCAPRRKHPRSLERADARPPWTSLRSPARLSRPQPRWRSGSARAGPSGLARSRWRSAGCCSCAIPSSRGSLARVSAWLLAPCSHSASLPPVSGSAVASALRR